MGHSVYVNIYFVVFFIEIHNSSANAVAYKSDVARRGGNMAGSTGGDDAIVGYDARWLRSGAYETVG